MSGEYAASSGTRLLDRGPWNPVPFNNYLSGDGKSHIFEGPGWYVPSERGWISVKDYRHIPPEARRDAIYMESEDQFVAFQRQRDRPHCPGGITMSGRPVQLLNTPYPQLLPFFRDAWSRPWDGAGWFVPPDNRWIHDHVDPSVPRDSFKFHNEEDWLKFKFTCECPVLDPLKD